MNRATDQRRRVVAPQVSGYRVGRLVGQGASSTVWEGTRSADGVKVALKVVAGGASSNGWRTEVEALRGVEHDHVVRLHDVVAAEPGGAGAAASAGVTGEPGSLILVLDLLEGGDLGGVVRARGHLSPGECVTVLAPLAGALAHLHARGVVHGDLAPGNVLFDLAGRPSLADLGTAQVVGRRSRAQWGTPGFVAAELLAGGNPEPASDVYALAALGWFALTGDTPPEVGAQRAAREVLGDRVPEPLLAVLSACLSPDPAQRPDAVAAASGFFDAVPAEPLHLIHADGTAGLTRRIRESALAAAERAEARDSGVRDGGAGRRRGLFEDPVPMLEPDRREVRRRARVAQRRRRADTVRRLLTSRVTLVSAGCAVVVGLGAVAVGGLWPSLTATPAISPTAQAAVSDQAVSDQAATADQATASDQAPNAAPAAGPGAELLRQVGAPRRDPEGTLRELSRLRAQALATNNRALAQRATTPGSPAREADEELLQRTSAAGLRYEGLGFDVSGAKVIWQDDSQAVMTATVTTSAHVVRDRHGDASERARAKPQSLRFTLRRQQGAWRVHDIATA